MYNAIGQEWNQPFHPLRTPHLGRIGRKNYVRIDTGIRWVALATMGVALMSTGTTQAKETRRDVFVRFGAPAGGTGARDRPYSSIQEMVDKYECDWGQVFLYPGVYRENVDIHRSRFWFFPAQQYGVVLEGTMRIRRPGIFVRGIDIRSKGDAIILESEASGCQIQQCRIYAVGEGSAGVRMTAGVSGCLISDNTIDLRESTGEDRTGIDVVCAPGAEGNRLDHNRVAGCDTAVRVAGESAATDTGLLLTSNRFIGCPVGLDLAGGAASGRFNRFERCTNASLRVSAGRHRLDAARFENGVGVQIGGGETVLVNALFAAPNTTAAEVTKGVLSILHGTIWRESGAGPLLRVLPDATLRLEQSILSAPTPTLFEGTLTTVADRPNLLATGANPAGTGVSSPGFRNPASGDFTVSSSSPAAKRGRLLAACRTDASGAGRPREQYTLGAFEVPVPPDTGQVAQLTLDRCTPEGIAETFRQLYPGDTLELPAGRFDIGTVGLTAAGREEAPITLRASSTGETVLVHSRIVLEGCDWVTLEGIVFENPPGPGVVLGAYTRYCTVRGCRIERASKGGGGALSISGPGSMHNLIEGNRIALNRGGVGVHINCQRHNWHQTVRGNTISGCYYGIQTGGGSYPTAPPGYDVIEGNTFHHNWKDGIHTKSTDTIIVGNHVHHNGSGGITTRYGARNVIVGNWITDNGGHGMRIHSPSHFILNNIVCRNGGNGIYAASWPGSKASNFPFNFEPYYEPPREVWIAHNTLHGNRKAAIFADNGAWLNVLRNVICGTGKAHSGLQFAIGGVARQADFNLYWQAEAPLLREYEGGRFDRVLEPRFADLDGDDYRPVENSAAHGFPNLPDALHEILRGASPAGVKLPDHVGANLGPPPGGRIVK